MSFPRVLGQSTSKIWTSSILLHTRIGHVHTIEWMQPGRWLSVQRKRSKLLKDATSFIKQILEETLKKPAVRQTTTHLEDNSN